MGVSRSSTLGSATSEDADDEGRTGVVVVDDDDAGRWILDVVVDVDVGCWMLDDGADD